MGWVIASRFARLGADSVICGGDPKDAQDAQDQLANILTQMTQKNMLSPGKKKLWSGGRTPMPARIRQEVHSLEAIEGLVQELLQRCRQTLVTHRVTAQVPNSLGRAPIRANLWGSYRAEDAVFGVVHGDGVSHVEWVASSPEYREILARVGRVISD